jgi:hypothetical protein
MKKWLFLFLLIPSLCFAQGLDSDTKLLLHGDLTVESESTTDGSLEVLDSVGSHVITQNGDAALQTSTVKFGSAAATFDGTGDYLSITDSADWDILADETTEYTIDSWVRLSDHSGAACLMTHHNDWSSDNDNWWYVRHEHGSGWRFVGKIGGTVFYTGYGEETTDNDWHHIAVIKVNANFALYVDGVKTGSDCDPTGTTTLSDPFRIGVFDEEAGPPLWFPGDIDEFRVQQSNPFGADPTTASSITVPTSAHTKDANTKLLLHMDSQDVSGDGGSDSYHIPEFVGDAQIDTSTVKWGDGVYEFDGTGDELNFAYSSDFDIIDSASSNQTVDFWVQHDDHAGDEAYVEHFKDTGIYWLWDHRSGNGMRFTINDGSTSATTEWVGEITDTDWHHLAMCKVGSDYGLYKNGTQIGYFSTSLTFTLNATLHIGNNYGDSCPLDGSMDEFRLQASNYFSASPNSTPDDSITTPTTYYSVDTGGDGRRIFIITEFIKQEGGGYKRTRYRQNFAWNGA